MGNVFARTITHFGLHQDQQNLHGFAYAILRMGDATYSTDPPFGPDQHQNPVKEIRRRLEIIGIGQPTLAELSGMLNRIEERYDRGGKF